MNALPNPFFFNLSAVASPAAGYPAAALCPLAPGAAAGPFESSSSTGGSSEAPAAAASNPKAAGLHVKYAALRREKAEEHRFVLDEAWFMADLVEKPLFLRGNWR